MFDRFPQSEIDIVGVSGSVRHRTKGLVNSPKVVIPDSTVAIEPGDEIRRKLPSGVEEVFDVEDVSFFEGMREIPAHYSVKVRRKGSFQPGQGGNYTVNVQGQNSRVNINSHDGSTNIAVDRSVFEDLSGAIVREMAASPERSELLDALKELKESAGKPEEFQRRYVEFVRTAASHMTLVGPFLPAISQFLGWGG